MWGGIASDSAMVGIMIPAMTRPNISLISNREYARRSLFMISVSDIFEMFAFPMISTQVLESIRGRVAICFLPIEVESHTEQVRGCCSVNRRFACDWMYPVEHDSRTVAPIPIESDGKVVVLAFLHVVEVQVGPPGFQFESSRADTTSGHSKVRVGSIAKKLGPVLSEPFEHSVLARYEPAGVQVRTIRCACSVVQHVDIAEKCLRLNRETPPDNRRLKIAGGECICEENACVDESRAFRDLWTRPKSNDVVLIVGA